MNHKQILDEQLDWLVSSYDDGYDKEVAKLFADYCKERLMYYWLIILLLFVIAWNTGE